jgi:hypothetical protein
MKRLAWGLGGSRRGGRDGWAGGERALGRFHRAGGSFQTKQNPTKQTAAAPAPAARRDKQTAGLENPPPALTHCAVVSE